MPVLSFAVVLMKQHHNIIKGGIGMDTEREAILGEVPATALLQIGREHLRLFLTSHRVIIAHTGKTGAGALASASLLGKLGGALENLVTGSRQRSKTESRALKPREILQADKDNFYVSYDEVVGVELDESAGRLGITVVTKDDKFRFQTAMPFQPVTDLFRTVLGDKVTARRASATLRHRLDRSRFQ